MMLISIWITLLKLFKIGLWITLTGLQQTPKGMLLIKTIIDIISH